MKNDSMIVSQKALIILGAIVLVVLGISIYSLYRVHVVANSMKDQVAMTTKTQSEYATKLGELEHNISVTQDQNTSITDSLRNQASAFQNQIENFGASIEQVTGTVGTLQKLENTDPELLQKYSKIYFLNENYTPSGLADIDEDDLYDTSNPQEIHVSVLPFLEDMFAHAKTDGVDLSVVSAYRSFGEQAALKSNYTVIYGAGTANQFSADQGYSEHQLGTAIDFTSDEATPFSGFDSTIAYSWLVGNANKYGFVLSYPKNNTYYTYEPWHWRFVGVALAGKLHKDLKNFYDMDQRDIDAYLAAIFD